VSARPSFRVAEESDAATLIEFMREYYAFDGHSFQEPKAHAALIALLRESNLGRVWLILDGLTPVGYIVLCFGYSLEWLGRDAFVDEFFLREEYRGRGWGRRTMEFVEKEAQDFGIRALHLEVVQQNRTALDVYRRLGFTPRASTFMSKRIAGEFSEHRENYRFR
jgi:GNAT superfamily N-acetyltransferase